MRPVPIKHRFEPVFRMDAMVDNLTGRKLLATDVYGHTRLYRVFPHRRGYRHLEKMLARLVRPTLPRPWK